MVNLYDLDPGPQTPEVIRMIVEIPKNSSNKYEFDGKLGVFRLDRPLYSPLHYPGDYGFVPGTLAEDGDPLDVLVLMSEPSFTGCLIEVRPLGFLEMVDGEERDQKILAVPKSSPRYQEIHGIDQVWPHMRREIEHFFTIYKELEGKQTHLEGWRGPIEARKLILDTRMAYLNQKAKEAAEALVPKPAQGGLSRLSKITGSSKSAEPGKSTGKSKQKTPSNR